MSQRYSCQSSISTIQEDSQAPIGGLQSLMSMTSLFTDTAGNIAFLIASLYFRICFPENLICDNW